MSEQIEPVKMSEQIEPVNNNTRRPSVQQAEAAIAASEERGPLAATPNTRKESLKTDGTSEEDVQVKGSVGQQNAPGSIGKVGENVMGGFGYGGSSVERPKEEQGLGEKIVNFLGA